MKRFYAFAWATIAALVALVALAPGSAHAAETAAADSTADIVTPLTLVNTDGLDFGRIIAGPTAGTVTISTGSAISTTGGVTHVGGGQNARFYGYGTYNRYVSIWLTSNTTPITRVGGGGTMTIRNFTIGSVPPTTLSTNPRFFRIAATNGFFSFTVGGTLDVGAAQAPGVYQGNFDVTIEYY